ncbi:MAG TPA: M23 family metallopeptidase [Solirubrobacteraceae bacterium]|nr:M23 family metallopeptidase [Solirubrobacteraceae bacterium]
MPASASAAPTGGAHASDPAAIRTVSCVAACAAIDAAKAGSTLRVRGRTMSSVAKIAFLGGRGNGDDVVARVTKARSTSVDVVVPQRASSGRLRAINGDGARSPASRAVVSVVRGDGGGPLDVRVIGRRVFYDAARQARVDLLAREPMAVTVTVVRVIDGAAVSAWPLTLAPGTVSSVRWDGRVAGAPQPPGRYEFRVAPGMPTAGAVAASAAGGPAAGAFDLVDHIFPVRGRHSYGAGQAMFGAARNGRAHEGQDVFARCGTRLVAARGGVVKLNQTHDAGGNYVVIDGEGTDVDYAYMHLRDRSPLQTGARVRTGQLVGHVGDTGEANGCHLHFEMWSGPGWNTGGAAFDPLPFLKAWDAYS